MSLHDRIRAARKDAGLSVNEFAKRLGVSSTAAWNWDWENTTPRPDKIPKIAEVLGVTVSDLTGSKGKDSNDQPDSLDSIVANARTRIALLLGTGEDRVSLEFKLI